VSGVTTSSPEIARFDRAKPGVRLVVGVDQTMPGTSSGRPARWAAHWKEPCFAETSSDRAAKLLHTLRTVSTASTLR
jgi:hypothetical protein